MAPARIFVSYAREDEAHRHALERHLAMLRRGGEGVLWHDGMIPPGREWEGKIRSELDQADVILFLVSADFLHSDYCWDVEVTRAMERHEAGEATCIPIFLRHADSDGAPFLKLQGLPPKENPVESWLNRDEAYAMISRGIRQALAQPRETSTRPSSGSVWHVPHRENPNFEGRAEILAALHGDFRNDPIQVLRGLPGVGKTQVATKYAYLHRADYRVVWWVRAETEETLLTDLARLAVRLGIGKESKVPAAVQALQRWLDENRDWLLIFDNAPDAERLAPHLPRSPRGHVLVTSRDPGWRALGEPKTVRDFTPAEAVRFLTHRTGLQDADGAEAVANALSRFPLALEHAAALMELRGIGFREYLAEFEKTRTELLDVRVPLVEYKLTVRATWTLAMEEAARRNPRSVELLHLLAFFDPDDIPRAWLREALAWSDGSRPAKMPPSDFEDGVAVLRGLSLVETTQDALALHRLVQEVVRESLQKETREQWAGTALNLIADRFPYEQHDVGSWAISGRLVPHALATLRHARNPPPGSKGRLCNKVGMYLHRVARLQEARQALELGLQATSESSNQDQSLVASLVNNLGSVLEGLGDLAGAKAHYERALRITEKAYGPDHPSVAIRVNNLGSVLEGLGDLAGAKAHYERALRIDEKAYGPDHQEVAIDVNNLGSVLLAMGDPAGARVHLSRAVQIFRQRLGPDHPHTVLVSRNLHAAEEAARRK